MTQPTTSPPAPPILPALAGGGRPRATLPVPSKLALAVSLCICDIMEASVKHNFRKVKSDKTDGIYVRDRR